MAEGTQRRLAAIVSADVVGYSRLMGVDETGTLAALRAHRAEMIDGKIAEHGGRIVKTVGDGLLLVFENAVDAVRCSIDVQEEMTARNLDVPDDEKIILMSWPSFPDLSAYPPKSDNSVFISKFLRSYSLSVFNNL